MIRNYIKLIRLKHWLKNILVFLPLFFSKNLLNFDLLFSCILAFLIFSLTSSVIYILNDLNDIENDKKHPIKKERPLASGAISKKQAVVAMVILAVVDVILMYLLYRHWANMLIFVIPSLYLIVNIFYSFGLKKLPIIDVAIIVLGFVLRVMYGGVVIDIEVSKYLYLMVIFGAFFLGFGKRRNEIVKNGNKSRSVLKMYNQDFLDKNMYVALALAIVSYTLWCVDSSTVARIGNDYVFWTVPLVMIILLLYSLDIEGDSHGDPTEVVLSDKKLLVVVTVYVLVMAGILYGV